MRNRAEDLHPVTSLPLPRRAINALTRGGIATLEETCDWSDDALLSLPQPKIFFAGRTLGSAQWTTPESVCGL